VRNDRQDHVSGMIGPISLKGSHDLRMVDVDGCLKNAEELRGEARPAAAEDVVVDLLDANAGEAAHEVEGVEELLEVEELDLPGIGLRGEGAADGIGGVAMAAASVMKDDRQLAQGAPVRSGLSSQTRFPDFDVLASEDFSTPKSFSTPEPRRLRGPLPETRYLQATRSREDDHHDEDRRDEDRDRRRDPDLRARRHAGQHIRGSGRRFRRR